MANQTPLPATEKSPKAASSLHPAFYIVSWIFFSNTTILFNKWIIDQGGFKYPVILTCWHLIFATLATQLLSRTTKLLDGRKDVKMTGRVYLRAVVPIGVLYSGSLVCSNWVYLYLNVAFIQMLKSSAPVAVLFISWLWGLANPTLGNVVNILVIAFGVALTSVGAIEFSWAGLLFQMGGIVFEAIRLVMIQVLLSGDDMKMDPLVSLYYYAPVCAVMNCFVALFTDIPKFQMEDAVRVGFGILLLNALVAFMLNVASVFLIGKTSSLVLTLAGILKAILLVITSVIIWKTQISLLQFFGYGVATAGLVYYSVGWDNIKALSAGIAVWTKAVWSAPDESRLSPLLRRTLIMGVIAVTTVVLLGGWLYDKTSTQGSPDEERHGWLSQFGWG